MNTCPKCGLVIGMHGSILPGCMCGLAQLTVINMENFVGSGKPVVLAQPEKEPVASNFCPRCGKRRGGDVNYIHTCTPPRGLEMT